MTRAATTHHTVNGLAVTRRRPAGTTDGRTDTDIDTGAVGTTVVLVHGAMDRAASFGRTMRRLTDGSDLEVIAYDRRGYAGSLDEGVAPTLRDHARDLGAVLDWSAAPSCVVVGHSLGGTIALIAAAAGDLPSTVRAVGVFESPLPIPGTAGPAGESALAAARVDGPAAAAKEFYRAMVGNRIWARLRDADRSVRLAEGPALVAELESLRRPGTAPVLSDIDVPVHVGRGGVSHPHLQEYATELATATGGTLTEIAAAGHGAHLSHPAEFARWVLTVGGVDGVTGADAPRHPRRGSVT